MPLTPKHGGDHIRSFAEVMGRIMAQEDPKRYLAVMSKAARKGRIFIATPLAPHCWPRRQGSAN